MLGYGGMVSFGHAAFVGLGAYAVGIAVARGLAQRLAAAGRWRSPSALVALVIGAISLRTRGVYFIMITLAFAQMLYYLVTSLARTAATTGSPSTARQFGRRSTWRTRCSSITRLALLFRSCT